MLIFEKKLFTKSECKKIIKSEKTNRRLWELNDRNYVSESIYFDENNDWIFNRLNEFISENIKFDLIEMKKEIHFHEYGKDSYFDAHHDGINFRIFSVGVILNDDYEGGDLILYDKDNEYIVNKKTGNVFIFDSKIKHGVTKIKEGTRYTLIYFIESHNIKLPVTKLL